MKISDTGKTVVIGRIGGAYGVKGWVKLQSFTDPPENIFEYQPWLISKQQKSMRLTIEDGKAHGKGLIAKIASVDDRDAAESLKSCEISVDRGLFPDLEAGEYYWSDLIGIEVVTVRGEKLGEIDHLFETGSNDVMVVKGDRERFIPFLQDDVVKSVDLEKKIMTVDWPSDF